MPERTIALVTALSPSTTTLAEYGLHLLEALAGKPGIRVVALVEDDPGIAYPEIAGVEIVPTWRFGSITNPIRIARTLRRLGADVALFNAHFTSFGSSKPAAAIGLLSPLMARVCGVPSMTLLHNLVETVDLTAAGFGVARLMEAVLRVAGSVVTWLVLRSNVVTTTMPRYAEILRSKYSASNVVLTPHGSFAAPGPPSPPPERPRVMTFGKFGTYKRVEPVIEAVRLLGRADVELVIAGTDSPNTPGYLADVKERWGGSDTLFAGYVEESEVENLFRESTVAVFPYVATTGSSGVLHQAGAFGCAPVLPLIGDLADLVEEEGYTGLFFEPDSTAGLAEAIRRGLDDAALRAQIAEHNYRAAVGLGIGDVVDWYLVHIGRLVDGDPLSLLRPIGAKG